LYKNKWVARTKELLKQKYEKGLSENQKKKKLLKDMQNRIDL